MNSRLSAPLLATLFLVAALCPMHPALSQLADDELASMIMEWRWESDDGYSTIDVSSSNAMLFEGKLYEFELYQQAFRFLDGGSSIPYRYDRVRDRLTLEFPEGPPLEYQRTIPSVMARRGTRRIPERAHLVFGRFTTGERSYMADGPPMRKMIIFHANGEFDFGPRTAQLARGGDRRGALGTALAYKNAIIFSFYDSSAAEAEIRTWDNQGEITGFTYAEEDYARAQYEAVTPPYPPPYPPDYPPGPPDPRPPRYPHPPYYPPFTPPVIVITPPSSAPSGAGGGDGKRTIGPRRDSDNDGSGSTGSRGSSGSSGGGSSSGGPGRGGNRR
jgi:uncharacterized membrane protein YgcG